MNIYFDCLKFLTVQPAAEVRLGLADNSTVRAIVASTIVIEANQNAVRDLYRLKDIITGDVGKGIVPKI